MLNYSALGQKCIFKLNAEAFRCLVLVTHCINPHLCVTMLEHFALLKHSAAFPKKPKEIYNQGCRNKTTTARVMLFSFSSVIMCVCFWYLRSLKDFTAVYEKRKKGAYRSMGSN